MKENLSSEKEVVTSLSKIFKNDKTFVPIKLTAQKNDPLEVKQFFPTDTHQRHEENSPASAKEQEGHKAAADNKLISSAELQVLQDQAYQKGLIDAQAKVEQKIQSTLETLLDACQKMDLLRSTMLIKNKEHMINIILTLTKIILKQELATKRDIIASTIETALDQAIQNDEYHITVHPDDLAVIEKMKPEIIATIRSLEHIVLKVDSKISKGGCLIESDTCSVDATIETQLENAKNFLLEHVTES